MSDFRHMTLTMLKIEALKLRKSRVGIGISIAIACGIPTITLALIVAIAQGNPVILAKVGPAATSHDWNSLHIITAQITAGGELLGFGILLAWIYAREFMDNTITGLLHIPASRAIIGMAKLGVYLGWGMLVHMLLTLIIMLLGCCLGYGLPPTSQLVSLLGVGFATLIVTIPIAWGTARARSLIAGFGITIVLLILGQLGGLSALGGWIPPAFPALWALAINPTTTPQFLVALGVSGFFTGLICIQWSHMQLP